jgi:hypothetical protein
MQFEFPKQQPSAKQEKPEEKKEILSADHDNIRNRAIEVIEEKILQLKDIGPNSPEIKLFQQSVDKLKDDSYVRKIANVNGWERARGISQDLAATDEDLAKKLAGRAKLEFVH